MEKAESVNLRPFPMWQQLWQRWGLKVMQIGCDPKADSTILLRHGEAVPAVLDLYNE